MIQYKRWWGGFNLLFQYHGSVFYRVFPIALLSATLTFLIKYFNVVHDDIVGGGIMHHPYPLHIFVLVISYITVMHTNMSYNRFWEARTVLQAMGSKWADCASQCIAFDRSSDRNGVLDGPYFRARCLHLFSLLHACCINYLQKCKNISYILIGNISIEDSIELLHIYDRPYQVLHWINCLIVDRIEMGGLAVPAPMQSRIFHQMSDAMLNFNQACKIEDTPFPFPYVQLLQFGHWVLTIITPFVVSAFVIDKYLASALVLVTVAGFWSMHEAAACMESPFGTGSNDLPLRELHDDFLRRLQIMLTEEVTDAIVNPKGPTPNREGLEMKETSPLSSVRKPPLPMGSSNLNEQTVAEQVYKSAKLPVDDLRRLGTLGFSEQLADEPSIKKRISDKVYIYVYTLIYINIFYIIYISNKLLRIKRTEHQTV
eukprot:GHVL01032151.1.p1 GENE.GHVL01032151.1~~GHVL01032151.1.p1  ORF type:complete len:428 (-),score=71.28 GHVL01032151.1:50-1333(-)